MNPINNNNNNRVFNSAPFSYINLHLNQTQKNNETTQHRKDGGVPPGCGFFVTIQSIGLDCLVRLFIAAITWIFDFSDFCFGDDYRL